MQPKNGLMANPWWFISPQGKVLQQAAVNDMATEQSLILIAGRYEGIDERLIQLEVDQEWSIGDYVLSGGELPAMVLIDALIRQIPGAQVIMNLQVRTHLLRAF